jgi:hypothetical protein
MADDNQDSFLGIKTIQPQDPNQANEAYQTPAILQITNWLDQLKNKPSFDKLDSERFSQARQLMSDSEIAKFTSMSIFNNILKKSEEYDRTQKLENSSEVITKQQEALEQNQALTLKKHQEDQEQNQASIKKLLSPKEIEYQRDFLNIITSNGLNKDSQAKEKESNSVNNGQTLS